METPTRASIPGFYGRLREQRKKVPVVRTIDYLTHEDLTRRFAEEGAAETPPVSGPINPSRYHRSG